VHSQQDDVWVCLNMDMSDAWRLISVSDPVWMATIHDYKIIHFEKWWWPSTIINHHQPSYLPYTIINHTYHIINHHTYQLYTYIYTYIMPIFLWELNRVRPDRWPWELSRHGHRHCSASAAKSAWEAGARCQRDPPGVHWNPPMGRIQFLGGK
jgi:hypothetical protein